MTKAQTRELTRDVREKYAFHDDIVYLKESGRGLSRETVEEISGLKGEPEWMLKFRLRAFEHFGKRPMPVWTDGLDRIDFDRIVYYRKPSEREERSWDDVPEQIKQTFERLGIPEAERKFLAGVGAQYDSEVVYHSVKEELSKLGVVFMGTDQGLKEYPEIFEKYFGTIVPPEDNKFAALNSAVWSGGSFVYVPPGVDVPLPLQAYFRINAENTGQFERTLIVVDEGAKVHYIEGCLPGSELVSLGDSFVPIETVEPGMAAMNSEGRLETVTSARKRPYQGAMLRIVPLSVGNAFELTPEHPVWTIRHDTRDLAAVEPEWVEAGKLEVGDFICFPVAQRTVDHPEISDDALHSAGVDALNGIALETDVMELPPSRQSLVLGSFLAGGGATTSRVVALQVQELLARSGDFAWLRLDGDIWAMDRESGGVWFDEGRSCFWVPIREITSRDYSGFVYNLEMAAAPNAYLARGFAVHNCTAPIYATDALHAAVVEVIALPKSKVRYTTIQNWSNDVYNLVTKRAHAYRDSTVEWIDANTGCLTADSMVLKNNDVVSIADIKPGDHVYSLTPQFEVGRSRVLATRENPPEQVYDLVLRNHRRVRATANHPFLVARKLGRTRKLGWTTLASIVPDDEIAIVGQVPDRGKPYVFPEVRRRKHLKVPIKSPVESSDDLMWVLGFYVGDGYPDGENRIVFAIPDSDPALPRLRHSVRDLFGLEMSRGAGVQLRATSGAFVDWIKAAGFGGNAHTKRVPDWVFRLPHSQKRAFIDGYIAADGHIRERFRNISIGSASRELLEQVRHLAISAGINALKISTWQRHEKLALGKEEKFYLANYLYFGDEKLDSPVHFVPITTIEPAGEQVTYDIEVEGTENFIANGVFVHNSKQTVKYPSIYLREEGSTADIISVAVAGHGQHQDTGAKAIHLAPNTRSRIVSKSVSKDGGRATYRGHVKVAPGATNVVASVRCDALMLDDESRSDTYPYIDIAEDDTTLTHEAVVGKISADQVFYLMSRGLTENEAQNLIVQGFLEVFTKELPMEYAIEFNRLVKMEMEGSLG